MAVRLLSVAEAFKKAGAVKGPPSLSALRAQADLLEQEQAAYGAPDIEQDKPGVFRKVVDMLSRPNYSIAGFAEEMLSEQPSVTRGVKRALSEIFSGVGGIQGEKRAFGEVLENLGVGTVTLADAFPALEGTWVGNFGSRGAAGLALDIALDPLTYITAGAARGAVRVIGSTGKEIALSQKGADAFNKILRSEKIANDVAALKPNIADPFRMGKSGIELKKVELAEKAFAKQYGKTLPKDFVDPAGMRWMGHTVMRGETFSDINKNVAKAVRAVPGGDFSLTKVGEFSKSVQRGINELFGSMGHLRELPPEMRARAIRLKRNLNSATLAHRQRIRGILSHGNGQLSIGPNLAKRWLKESAADPDLGKKFYDLREKTGTHVLTGDQQVIFDEVSRLYDSMGRDLVDAGVFDKGELVENAYFHHSYTQESLRGLDQYHANLGTKFTGQIKEAITKERPFKTYREAREVSAKMNALQTDLYPVLVPEYDVLKNLNKYVDQYADSIGRKAWHEEAIAQFGVDPTLWDKTVHWSTLTGRSLAKSDVDIIRPLVAAEKIDAAAAGAAMKKLSGEGKSELLGHMIENAKTPAETIETIMFAEKRGLSKYMPEMKVTDGDFVADSYQKMYGESARLVRRSGKIWGDREIMVPEIIAKDIESIDSTIFNTKDWAAFRAGMAKFDQFNNHFKVANYTIFPSSHIRNMYSNVSQSGLDISLGALDPRVHREAIAIMAGKELGEASFGGFTRGELRQMFRDYQVWVPGRTFVEATGKRRLGRLAGKAADIAGVVENEARIVLALQNIKRGIHPRQAADHVGEFLFHYNELSRFERDVMRRIFPFYTWTRKNIQLQVQALKRTPGRVINQLKPFRGRTSENEQMVQWEAEGLKLRMDRDGKTVHMLTGIDLPLRNLDTLWRGGIGKTGRGIAGMVTPLIKTIPEVLLNRDFFLGRDLTRTQSGAVGRFLDTVPTPKGVKDWLGYKKEVDAAGRPRYSFDGRRFTLLFRSWVFSRALSTTDRQFRKNMSDGGPEWQNITLDVLTGIRNESMNMDEEMRRKMEQHIRQLEESATRRGLMREYRKRYTPKNKGREVSFQ